MSRRPRSQAGNGLRNAVEFICRRRGAKSGDARGPKGQNPDTCTTLVLTFVERAAAPWDENPIGPGDLLFRASLLIFLSHKTNCFRRGDSVTEIKTKIII